MCCGECLCLASLGWGFARGSNHLAGSGACDCLLGGDLGLAATSQCTVMVAGFGRPLHCCGGVINSAALAHRRGDSLAGVAALTVGPSCHLSSRLSPPRQSRAEALAITPHLCPASALMGKHVQTSLWAAPTLKQT